MTNQDPIAAWRLRYGRTIEHLGDTELAEARRCGDEAVGLMRATPDGDAAAEIERLRAENERLRMIDRVRDLEAQLAMAFSQRDKEIAENDRLTKDNDRVRTTLGNLRATMQEDDHRAWVAMGRPEDTRATNVVLICERFASLQADLAAARAALGRINEVVSPCGWTNPEDVVGRVQQRAAQRKQSDRMYQRLVDDLNADLAAARADQAAMARRELEQLKDDLCGPYPDAYQLTRRRLAALPAQQPEPKPIVPALDTEALIAWMLGDDTGLSSECIAATVSGSRGNRQYHPCDMDDFGRCRRLVESVKGVRERLPMVADVSPVWRRIVQRWDDICTKGASALRLALKDDSEQKPDAATRDGDEVLRELAQWAGGEGINELWRAVAEICRRELARGGK